MNRALGIGEELGLGCNRETHYQGNREVPIPSVESRGSECNLRSQGYYDDTQLPFSGEKIGLCIYILDVSVKLSFCSWLFIKFISFFAFP